MTLIFNRSEQTPLRKKLRNSMTKSETVLWKHLKGSQIGFKFRRQCGIGKYIADFYCPSVRLVIEVDGITHYDPKVLANDREKEMYFQSLGLTVKRYSTEQVFHFIQEVIGELRWICTELQRNHPLPPPSEGGDSTAN